jgi:diguanylate cyclase (GGDEF)-like protein
MAHDITGNRFTGALRKHGFLRESLYLILIWPLVCLGLGLLLCGLTQSNLSHERQHVKERTARQASSLSKAYAAQLERSVEQIDQITLNLQYYWQKAPRILNLQEQLQRGLYPASANLFVTINNRNGKPVTSTINFKKDTVDISQREHFLAHKNDASIDLLITKPVMGIQINKMVILFSRRLEGAGGVFSGIVVAAIEPVYLASHTDESSLGKGDFLSVRSSDGGLFAAKMGQSISSTTSIFRSPPIFDMDRGVVRMPAERFVDNESRVIAWQKLKNYPLVSIVGLSERERLAPYEAMARDYRRIAVAASVFLVLLALTGMAFSARLAWRKREAEEVKNTYRLATDGAREGFYMLRPLYDHDKTIVDFLIKDCNERGAAYYGKLRANLIGTKFSGLFSTGYQQEVLPDYRRAMEIGFYENELKVSTSSSLQVNWVHRRLVRSGDGLAVTLRDISESKAHEEALSSLANADALTALPNRHWLMSYLPIAVERARSSDTVLALLFVDLDDFKNINDTLGHAAGDELLQAAAKRLKSVVRPHDSVVRLGGDEFTIILEKVDGDRPVSQVAERMIKALSEPFVLSGESRHVVHASIGISLFPHHGEHGETLLKHADIAMYAAKARGKANYQFFQPHLSENLVTRLNKERALRLAIERDEFVLHYQPRVDTASGELRSIEALVRWTHPEHGLVPPNEFISMAEETGVIVPLGETVIEKVCAQLAQWKAADLPVVPVSINVSPRQFNQGNLSAHLASCMTQHAISAALIEVEITESCMVGEDHTVTGELAAIEALGIKLLVDDFGTGYSSLSQLRRLDMDGLKVDRAFTAQLSNGKEDEAFFLAMLSMAHALGMSVVAEGVETVEQLRILQRLSCDEVQGYLISKPVPASEVPSLVRKRFLLPPSETVVPHDEVGARARDVQD